MRYRQLDANGDYVLGQPFLQNTPATVAQAVLTRLNLWQGEWFLDTSDGTPYNQQVLGKRNGTNPDAAIKQRILGTPEVTAITSYQSAYNGATRALVVSATLTTSYGTTAVQTALSSR